MKKKILILLAVLASCSSVYGAVAMDEAGKNQEKESTIFRQNLEPSNMEALIQPGDKQSHDQQVDVMREDQIKINGEADKEKDQKKTDYIRVKGSLGSSGL